MNEFITFDQSLPVFASLVASKLGKQALQDHFFLRDVSGRLTFVVSDDALDENQRATLAGEAAARLPNYVDPDGFAVATPSELFDERLRNPDGALTLTVKDGPATWVVRVIDRRMVGADWLRTPSAFRCHPSRLAFVSLKGGVGRSTALCVLAAELAAEGRRILTIDLDLEAPGLGNMLLVEETLPKFGLLDYLVERSLSPIDDDFVVDMVATSWLGGGRGLVDVVPAIGSISTKHPENVLGKIARAYLADSDTQGATTTFTDHVAALLTRLTDLRTYDAVLIDARAGLHETTAAAIVGLGADVLCFGLDQPQTYAGYKLLFAHLSTLPTPNCDAINALATSKIAGEVQSTDVVAQTDDTERSDGVLPPRAEDDLADDWRDRLRFVHAKASGDSTSQKRFNEWASALLRATLLPTPNPLERDIDVSPLSDEFDVIWDQQTLPTVPVSPDSDGMALVAKILDDSRYASFDPLVKFELLERSIYETTYGSFLSECKEILKLDQSGAGQ